MKLVRRSLLLTLIICSILPKIILTIPHIHADTQPTIEWNRTFGGSGDDWGFSVQQTFDGGYIIVGHTDSFGEGEKDVYLIKTDSDGNELWYKTYGGSNSDVGYSVKQTTDGGYIIAGATNSFGVSIGSVYLVKTDFDGNELWYKTLGSGFAWSVQETSDKGYIVVGTTSYFGAGSEDVYLIKTDSYGNKLWYKTFGGSGSDWGWSVQETSDGGYIIAGWKHSLDIDKKDVYLIKTDADGNEIWSRTFGGSDDDRGMSVQETSDGGFIVVGHTKSFGAGNRDVYLIKTDLQGNDLWQKTFGGLDDDHGQFVQQTTDGGYIIVGRTKSFGAGSDDVYLIKTDSEGNEIWSRMFGGSNSDLGWSFKQTSDGDYIIVGHTESFGAGGKDIYLIKIGVEINNKTEESQIPSEKGGVDKINDFVLYEGYKIPSTLDLKPVDITEVTFAHQHNEFILKVETLEPLPEKAPFGLFEAYIMGVWIKVDQDNNKLLNAYFIIMDEGWGYNVQADNTLYFRKDAEHWKENLWKGRLPIEYEKFGNVLTFKVSMEYPTCKNAKIMSVFIYSGYEGDVRIYDFFPNQQTFFEKWIDYTLKFSLTCLVSAKKIEIDRKIIVSGHIIPALTDATITLIFIKPDGSTFSKTVRTTSDGNYTHTFQPEEEGYWIVTAYWPGDVDHKSAASPKVSFEVEQKIPFWETMTGIIFIGGIIAVFVSTVIFLLRKRI